jgi:hypothetical protein
VEKLPEKFKKLVGNGILSAENIHQMIDENAENLRPEIKANESRWPLDEVGYFKVSDFEKEVQLIKDWIEKRILRIDNYLIEDTVSFNCFGPVTEPELLVPPMLIHKPVGSAVQIPGY